VQNPKIAFKFRKSFNTLAYVFKT